METDARQRINRYLMDNPGASTRMVAQGVGLSDSTVDYHLRRLQKQGQVVLARRGREATWWRNGCGFCPVLRRAIPAFRREEVALTARALGPTPATAVDLALLTGLPLGVVRWAAALLVQAGIARRSARGRLLLAEGAQTCVEKAVTGTRCALWGRCPLSRTAEKEGGAQRMT